MRTSLTSLALMFVAALAACGPAATLEPTAAPPTATISPARADTLTIKLQESPAADDIPRHMAVDALRAQGYEVNVIFLEEDSLIFVAMGQGELDLSAAADIMAWQAVGAGVPVQVLMDESANQLMVAASNEIQACADLDGKRVALNNLTGNAATLFYRYIDTNCPGIEPEYLVIGSSGNRMAALFAGEVDAAATNLYRFITLDEEQAANVHSLVFYEDEFPGFSGTSFYIRRGLAEQYPETAKDVIRAVLTARRSVQDPEVLTQEIINRLELEPGLARKVADAFLERHFWDLNGGYDLDAVQAKIDFYVATGDLPADLEAAEVADLSYLEAVLEEMGRE